MIVHKCFLFFNSVFSDGDELIINADNYIGGYRSAFRAVF